MQKSHHTTVQLSGIRLTVRDDLSLSVREFGGDPHYVIEDELNSRFYRIGQAEYTFLALLDGHTTFADALGRTASAMKEDALNEREAASFCQWLVQTGLASTAESRSSARLFEAAKRVADMKLRRRMNPIFVKIPLFNPDELMRVAAACLGWLLTWPVFLVWLAVVAVGCASVSLRWNEATSMTSGVISGNNWIWLTATWLLLKVIHETAHGVACRRYGGAVREAGVLTILFVPLPYVDVTATWRFESRRQRMMVSAAGMYAELFLAAIAAIVWYRTEPGLLHQHAFNAMLTASVITLLFNANPLMRFDGYYLLTDLLEMPNLASHGQMCILQTARRVFCALPAKVTRWPEGRTWLVFVYGILALCWRVLICAGIVLAADALFFGAGIVIAALAIAFWVVLPFGKMIRFIAFGTDTEKPSRTRFLFVAGGLAVVMLVIGQLPWYEKSTAPAVVDFDPVTDVRAGTSGFVDQVLVQCGDEVSRGTVLVRLSNPEMAVERNQLHVQLLQAQQRSRVFHQNGEIAAWQIEEQNARTLTQRIAHIDHLLSQSEILAPHNGIVLDSHPESLTGSWMSRGETVVSLGAAEKKRLLVLISEDQIDAFTARSHQDVQVHIDGTGLRTQTGLLLDPEPRASTRIIHHAFASSSGGPLDVRVAKPEAEEEAGQLELLRPHFVARVGLDSQFLDQFQPGRSGIVALRVSRGTIRSILNRRIRGWWLERREALQRQAERGL